MHHFSGRRALAAFSLSLLTFSAGASVVDQTSAPGNSTFNVNNGALVWQQQVVTGLAGVLSSIDLFTTGTDGAPLQAFRVSINKGFGWQSDADDFSTVVTPVEGVTSIDVSSAALFLSVGDAFMIGVAGLGPNGACCTLKGSGLTGVYAPGDLYLGGSLYNSGGYDFAFNTRVGAAVPEPASILLVASLLAGLGAVQRRMR